MIRLSLAFVAFIGFVTAIPNTYRSKTIYVENPKHSIQQAIKDAQPGDTIIVKAGTYKEQLTISKSYLTLIGHGAILKPPNKPSKNTCSGLVGPSPGSGPDTQAGICITGYGVDLQPFPVNGTEHRLFKSVKSRVNGVKVTGFTVSDFDLNVAILAAENTHVEKNTLINGNHYGALTVGSKRSHIDSNTVTSTTTVAPNSLRFIGICMDDVASVVVSHNFISGYMIGLCLQTDGANVYNNQVKNVCIGAFADPGKKGIKVQNNEFKNSNPYCLNPSSNAFFIAGMFVLGASDMLVKSNKFSGFHAGNPNFGGVGITILDNKSPDGTVTLNFASGNIIQHNEFKQNDLDIFTDAKGKNNVEKPNSCKSSIPKELCQ